MGLAVLPPIHQCVVLIDLLDWLLIHGEDNFYRRVPKLILSELVKVFLHLIVVRLNYFLHEDVEGPLDGDFLVVFFFHRVLLFQHMPSSSAVHVASRIKEL